jgi:hypothetical protein
MMKTLVILFSLLFSTNSFAQLSEDELLKRAMDNISHDALTCFAYYSVVVKAIETHPKTEQIAIDPYQAAADNLMTLSTTALEVTGRSTEMGQTIKECLSFSLFVLS